MTEISNSRADMEKLFSDLSIEQLSELEKQIHEILGRKRRGRKRADWRKDLMQISAWDHLDNTVRVDKWEIENL